MIFSDKRHTLLRNSLTSSSIPGRYAPLRLLGSKVLLIRDPEADDRDRYGRLLRFVELPDGTDFSAELVGRGLARVMLDYSCSRKPDYLRAEELARERGLGIWAAAAEE